MGSDQNSLPSPAGAADEQLPHNTPNNLLEEQHSHPLEDFPKIDLTLQPTSAARPGESMLETLPNELLDKIAGALAPGSLYLEPMWFSWYRYRKYTESLRSLCLVSKTIDAIVRPVLYRDVRLFSHMAVVHLCATFCADPTLASSVRSIMFCPRCEAPHREPHKEDTRTVDLRPLRPFQDPDYAFWTTGKRKAKTRMPQKARKELVYILFSKALSRIPALKSLYFTLPELHSIYPHRPKRLPHGTQLMQQLSLQERLFQDFCQGQSLPDLSRLSTVGLGREPTYDVKGLCDSLFRSPNLHEVLFGEGHCYGLAIGPQHSESSSVNPVVDESEIGDSHLQKRRVHRYPTQLPSPKPLPYTIPTTYLYLLPTPPTYTYYLHLLPTPITYTYYPYLPTAYTYYLRSVSWYLAFGEALGDIPVYPPFLPVRISDFDESFVPTLTIKSTNIGIPRTSPSVKRAILHHQLSITQDTIALARAFPSLESLRIDNGPRPPDGLNPLHGHQVFQLLGGLKNFHTLEMDASRAGFATAITTRKGPSTLVTLSALTKLRTLLVRVDFFVGLRLFGRPYRETTVLPDSLRRLTLLLNSRYRESLARGYYIPQSRAVRMVERSLRVVAPALLDEYPHLERVDLCYDMDHYREDQVQTLAERSTADGGSIL